MTTFLDYCPKCDRTTPHTNVRIECGYNEVCQVCKSVTDIDLDDEYDDYQDCDIDNSQRTRCYYCNGEGYGIVGTDWESDDPINGPYDGETTKCPCCHGTGKAEDETFW